MRFFAGRILSFDGGESLFLDVVWLSKVLSPILTHKLSDEHPPTGRLCESRDELAYNGVLRVDFARHLWRNVLE